MDETKTTYSPVAKHKPFGMSKGSKRRPPRVAEPTVATRWCAAWGHRIPEGWDRCITCGALVETRPTTSWLEEKKTL